MRHINSTIILLIIVLGLFPSNASLTLGNSKREIKVVYNGLIWVFLDSYSIWKYGSEDKPIDWVKVISKEKFPKN